MARDFSGRPLASHAVARKLSMEASGGGKEDAVQAPPPAPRGLLGVPVGVHRFAEALLGLYLVSQASASCR